MSTKTTQRLPDSCVLHPDSRAVLSKTTASTMHLFHTTHLFHTITQHRCAEPGCNRPLGWYYHGPDGAFQYGPAICNDQDVLLTVARHKHDQEDTNVIFGFLFLASFLAIALWGSTSAFFYDAAVWTNLHTATVIPFLLIAAAGLLTYHRASVRSRPAAPWPDDQLP